MVDSVVETERVGCGEDDGEKRGEDDARKPHIVVEDWTEWASFGGAGVQPDSDHPAVSVGLDGIIAIFGRGQWEHLPVLGKVVRAVSQ